ncbi:hypothetical protein Taro_044131 [Colocasia esculenta]|uniref:Uncharacterized protein n=1 Tax=Colocasia esculenta TaxID=4460 RepID=A0A843X237_COLES|nr:hypothetical protein [Colocasia esculenta]
MQGLVQAMQTQAQTQAALQAQLQAQAQAPAPVPQEHGHGGPSIMERLKRMAPPSFKGESKPLLAESWMREVEKIFRAIRQESKMDQYLKEKRAAHKRSPPPFQRQDRKKAVYQSPQHPVAATSQQTITPQSPSFQAQRQEGVSSLW